MSFDSTLSTVEIRVISCSNVLPRYFSKLLPTLVDTRPPSQASREHLAIRYRQSYGVIRMLLSFSKIWWLPCSLFAQHCCLLFFKFALIFARAEVQRERYSKISAEGNTFVKKIRQI